jgi:3-oxoacyl-[acyl-carrier protein] reductase
MRFKGRGAIVTGSARGIGRAIADRLASEGARVLIADIDEAAATTAAAELGLMGEAFPLDVTSEDSWKAAVLTANNLFGSVDSLVNNAGIHGRAVPTWELRLEEWQHVLAIDLTGVFLGCQAVLPGMLERSYGRIVNISSIAGKEGNPNAVAYSSAKAGVIGLTKAIAKEVATKGIIVNAITPAVIETEILKQLTQQHIEYMLAKIPMSRTGKPHEVATLTAFLCSEEISYTTGSVFDISGGRATY